MRIYKLASILFVMFLFTVLCSVLLGCERTDNEAEPSRIDYTKLRCERSQLETERLDDVWGSSLSDVFAVGTEGVIFHYDGSTWNIMNNDTSETILGIWGTSPSNVYAVTREGSILHFDGHIWETALQTEYPGFTGIWGSSESDIFTVGYQGIILHYDGDSWDIMESNTTSHIIDIWGSSSDDVYAVGSKLTILHYDGSTWSTVTSDDSSGHMYTGVWGSAPDNVMVIGGAFWANMIAFDGYGWNSVKIDSEHDIGRIDGSSASNVFAAGSNGNVLHYNGEEWNSISNNNTLFNDFYNGVWTYSLSDTFVVGSDGVVLHYIYEP
jgi:hypothetical protein